MIILYLFYLFFLLFFFQLPVDFCGGVLEPLTETVHMLDGKVYDPVIGQWMTPDWQGVVTRVTRPNLMHLYRFNGNDPINYRRDMGKPKGELVTIILYLDIIAA